jgi:hypothetical protein
MAPPLAPTTVIVGVTLLAFLWGVWEWGRQHGEARLAAKIERTNQEARDAARKASRSVDDCYRDGGVWDQTTGLCAR